MDTTQNPEPEIFVYFIDDQESQLKLTKLVVKKNLPHIKAHFFTSAIEALESLDHQIPTVIVTDWEMPQMDGMQLTKVLNENKEKYPSNYIIFLTGKDDSRDLALALEQGAHDYIVKPFNKNELVARVNTGIRTLKLEHELILLNKKLERLSTIDTLTEVYNRRYGNQKFAAEINKVHRGIQDLSIQILDIDHFKKVNDSYGHNMGDEALRVVSQTLRSLVRDYDSIIRWGGEEFIILSPGLGEENAVEFAERVRKTIESSKIQFENTTIQVTVSIGLLIAKAGEKKEIKDLIGNADKCLYKAKETGRNKVVLHKDTTDK